MLTIRVPETEYFIEESSSFGFFPGATLQLEHSLISLSKWESKWKKPFLTSAAKTREELKDYIRCMTVNNVPPETYDYLTKENIEAVNAYIHDPYSATTFKQAPGTTRKRGGETQTSELIYYYMVALEIPFECQKWHLNRLLTLIHICAIKNDPKSQKKMSPSAVMSQNKALNAARRAKYGTKG